MDNVIYRRVNERACNGNPAGQPCGVMVTQEVNGFAVWTLSAHPDGAEHELKEFRHGAAARELALESAILDWEAR